MKDFWKNHDFHIWREVFILTSTSSWKFLLCDRNLGHFSRTGEYCMNCFKIEGKNVELNWNWEGWEPSHIYIIEIDCFCCQTCTRVNIDHVFFLLAIINSHYNLLTYERHDPHHKWINHKTLSPHNFCDSEREVSHVQDVMEIPCRVLFESKQKINFINSATFFSRVFVWVWGSSKTVRTHIYFPISFLTDMPKGETLDGLTRENFSTLRGIINQWKFVGWVRLQIRLLGYGMNN